MLFRSVASSAQYSAIYSGFAIIVVALIWVYLSWLILLLGADVAFYHQNPLALRGGRSPQDAGAGTRERVALAVMYLVASDFAQGRTQWTASALSARFTTPSRVLGNVVRALQRRTLLLETEDGRLVPARDLGSIKVSDILTAARYGYAPDDGRSIGVPQVDAVIDEVDNAITSAVETRTLRDLVSP